MSRRKIFLPLRFCRKFKKDRMKLLVFAHVPPPHHGQSYAVKLMLENFGGDRRVRKTADSASGHFGVECYHVNAQFSRGLEDIGMFQSIKLARLSFHCLEAIWCRFRYGVDNFYYVPAPGKNIALYRDWLVMLICRPFFKKVIFHWHAAGLAKWLETTVSIRTRSFTYRRMRDSDLSIVLSDFNRRDAEKLTPRCIAVVGGGIPDPCPQFVTELLPRRRARIAARKKILTGASVLRDAHDGDKTVNVLFLAHCTREKGVFDAIEGVVLANEKLAAKKSPLRFRLTLIGAFASDAEEKELRVFVKQRDPQGVIEILGFVPTERKEQALCDADIFCFPTYYLAENQPGNLIEAMAFGLPIVTTRWRSIPEMLPPDYPGIVDPKSPEQIAEALQRLATTDLVEPLREMFLHRFTLEQHLARMAEAIHSVEAP
jgi:glycosyltransferase involved in cell wall biosynthesis